MNEKRAMLGLFLCHDSTWHNCNQTTLHARGFNNDLSKLQTCTIQDYTATVSAFATAGRLSPPFFLTTPPPLSSKPPPMRWLTTMAPSHYNNHTHA